MAVEMDQAQLMLPAPTKSTSSGLLMKKVTAVYLSMIAYCRNLFDENDFHVKSFNGVTVRVVKGGAKNSVGVQCLNAWLKGAFDALDKKFLKTLYFDIADVKGTIIESYHFNYSYKSVDPCVSLEVGDSSNVIGQEVTGSTRSDIQGIMRNILVITQRDSLPPKCTTSVRLTYHDDVTPDYEPPGFRKFEGNVPEFADPNAVLKWKAGKVSTSFHTLTVYSHQSPHPHRIELPCSNTPRNIDCPCGAKDNVGRLLQCENCGSFQHSACFKVFSEENSQSQRSHKCHKCRGPKSTEDLNLEDCEFRRVLCFCAKNNSISIKKLTHDFHLDTQSAILNMRRLQREGALQKSVQPISLDKSEFNFIINKTALVHTLKSKYFEY